MSAAKRRAIGIIRVSDKGDRFGDSFASPDNQRERIEAACARDGLRLVDAFEEVDVKGSTPLEKRVHLDPPGNGRRVGLLPAVEMVEAGKADVVMAAYFDRLMRSLKVQREVVERVEAAGGEVLALDVGQVTEATATRKLQGTLVGAFAEYQADTARERSGDATRRALERGVLVYPGVPLGYRRGPDGKLQVEPTEAPLVAQAFQLRAAGASISEVQTLLRDHGIAKSFHVVQRLLASPVVLGEIHFGKLVNTEAHEPIVDRDVWNTVQAVKVPRGRQSTSDRLLARLGVLRCSGCGSRMTVGTTVKRGNRYPLYRCPGTGQCQRRVAISATLAEKIISDRVRAELSDMEGRASAQRNVRNAEAKLSNARDALSGAIEALSGFEDVPATRSRLERLRQDVEAAEAHLDQLGGASATGSIRGDAEWDQLLPAEQRALIRATVKGATVAPGRGADRIAVELFVQ